MSWEYHIICHISLSSNNICLTDRHLIKNKANWLCEWANVLQLNFKIIDRNDKNISSDKYTVYTSCKWADTNLIAIQSEGSVI